MKYTLIKWIGSLLIIFTGLVIAYNHTYKWKVSEKLVYELSLPENTFVFRDGFSKIMKVNLIFDTKQFAKDVEKNRKDELLTTLRQFFLTVDSTQMDNPEGLEQVKTELLLVLRDEQFMVKFLNF